MGKIKKRSNPPTQNPSEPRRKDKARQIKEAKESDNPLKKNKRITKVILLFLIIFV